MFFVNLRGADSNIFPVWIFRRQLVTNIQMFVNVVSDPIGLSGDDVTISSGAIEVSDRVLEDGTDLLRPRVQDDTTSTEYPGIVKSKGCRLSKINLANKFNVSEGSVTRPKRMSLLVH